METAEQVDARKIRIGRKEALALASQASRLIVVRGNKIVRVDLKKEKLGSAEIAALLLGPSGNLRAPTIRVTTGAWRSATSRTAS